MAIGKATAWPQGAGGSRPGGEDCTPRAAVKLVSKTKTEGRRDGKHVHRPLASRASAPWTRLRARASFRSAAARVTSSMIGSAVIAVPYEFWVQ